MPVIPAGYAHAELQFLVTGDAEPMLSTFGLKLDGGANVATANSLMAAFATPFATQLATVTKLTGLKLTVGDDGDPLVYQSSSATASFSGGTALPQNCAFLVRKRTASGGRRNRGRMFLPGCNDNLVDELGNVTSAGQTSLQTACTAFLTAVQAVASVEEMVILHTPTVETPLPTVVTSLAIDPRIATQRRRLRP